MATSPQVKDHSELEVASQYHTAKGKVDSPYDAGGHQYTNPTAQPRDKTFCGLRSTTFLLCLALIFVIIAAAIGGGVGGTLAVKNAKKACQYVNSDFPTGSVGGALGGVTATATTTLTVTGNSPLSTPTSSGPLSVPTEGTLLLNCPTIDNTNLRITLDRTSLFVITCGQDISGPDIVALTAYSLKDCGQACASYNRNLQSVGCRGAVFNSDLKGSVDLNFGNCFLKNDTRSRAQSSLNHFASIVLQ